MRLRARTDDNHTEIMEALRGVGVSVFSTHQIGKGFPDLVCGYRKSNFLLEVKDGSKPPSRRKLTDDEKEFIDSWRGEVHVVKNVDEALTIIQKLTD